MRKNLILQKIKILFLLVVFLVSSFNVFTQNTSLISDCGDFIAGPSTWPFVLVATTIDSGAASQAAQTYTMNVTSLPAGGANVRVYKTVANGNAFFGNPVALTLGSNSITVAAVNFDRAVKFQFSSGDVEFDALVLNGDSSDCVTPLPPSPTSLISDCGDFIAGPSAWPYVLVATTIADGSASQSAQTFTMNVTSLPAGGANVRVYKTTANGNDFFGNPVALTLCSNSITVAAVNFDRAVKFQFSSGDVEFDALVLNGDSSECVSTTTSSVIDVIHACDSYTWIDGNTYTSSNNTATYILNNASGCDSVVSLDLTITSSSSFNDVVYACDSYTWIDGNTYTSSNNTATHILNNAAGCDSIVTLDLTITSSSSFTDVVYTCDSYTWIDGNIYTSSNNTATHILNSAAGCDSIVTLDLTITNVDSAVVVLDDSTLQAQSVVVGTTYQWLDCNDNFAQIFGENNAIFTTQNSGYYAVEVTLNDCSVISDCFNITSTVGIYDLDHKYEIQLFPNPTKNYIIISLDGISFVDILILDLQGKVLLQQFGLFDQDRINISDYVAGTYFIKIITPEGSRQVRITKQ
ncbi:MAG: hypothetical protein CMD15_01950 [Flavobacteriales bacterium]|nr:hypothetical protein [Flavobacteriales bacterium]